MGFVMLTVDPGSLPLGFDVIEGEDWIAETNTLVPIWCVTHADYGTLVTQLQPFQPFHQQGEGTWSPDDISVPFSGFAVFQLRNDLDNAHGNAQGAAPPVRGNVQASINAAKGRLPPNPRG